MNGAEKRLKMGEFMSTFELSEMIEVALAHEIVIPDTLTTKEEVLKLMLDQGFPLFEELGDKY